ncbi:hypothetical protein GDO81_018871 [Engystomops pustulosus]|uniref:Uncharacterized protein n=1 Tax=Engystomops pustulosus TaxID=76066 RepID=A0AAV6ZP54_ENGPU|nr:hypothetical protein GDO81_018871 [Engystomops pustulosus]
MDLLLLQIKQPTFRDVFDLPDLCFPHSALNKETPPDLMMDLDCILPQHLLPPVSAIRTVIATVPVESLLWFGVKLLIASTKDIGGNVVLFV